MLLFSRYDALQKIYDEYIHGLPADDALIPNIADVALSPPVHAILTDERTDFLVTRETFENINLMQTLPSIVSDWKIRLDDELVRMVQAKLSEHFTKDQLLLATTVFYCDACYIDLFYPQVLVHRCSSPYRVAIHDSLDFPAWNSFGNIKFDRNIHQAAIDIIDILGLDPKAVTAEDMTVRNRVLQCLDCRATRQGRMTMIWSRAVRKQIFRKRSFLNLLFFWFRFRLSIVGRNIIAYPRWYLGKFLGMTDSWCWRRAWLRHLLHAIIWIRSKRGSCVAFAGGRKNFSGSTNTSCRRELFIWWFFDIWKLIYLFLLTCRHGIQDPGEHDILFHPDAIHVPMPFVLPETD